jgi:hypothetical protein
MPFPLPEYAPGENATAEVQAIADIFARVSSDHRFNGLGHEQLIADAKFAMTKHVYAYFDISPDEEILIDDVVTIFEGSVTPSRGSDVPTLKTPREIDRQRYANTLIEALQGWAGASGNGLSARCVLSEKSGLAVLTIEKSRGVARYSETKASADLDQALLRLKTISPERYGNIVYLRNLAVLERDRMHVVKPLTMRFWLRSTALNDADTAASHLLNQRQGRGSA